MDPSRNIPRRERPSRERLQRVKLGATILDLSRECGVAASTLSLVERKLWRLTPAQEQRRRQALDRLATQGYPPPGQ